MTSPGGLPQLKDAQRAAAEPDRHVWLSASAGTGKTQVLVARILRLLLDGCPPGNLLALTFTKAGAAEMVRRLGERLAFWVRAEQQVLRKDLLAIGAAHHDDATLARARQLFAHVLDTPGGLKIQTIHAFCQTLLAGFPVEAGLAPGFRAIEGREQRLLARRVLSDLLVDAESRGDKRLIDAVRMLSLTLGEGEAQSYLLKASGARDALAVLADDPVAQVRILLGAPLGDIGNWLAERCSDGAFDAGLIRDIARANAEWAGKNGWSRHDVIMDWLAASPAERAASLDRLHLCWATAKENLRVAEKKLLQRSPDYDLRAAEAMAWSGGLREMCRRACVADRLAEALFAARAYAEAYAGAKRGEGVVDFDDLIQLALDLLNQSDIGPWISYKLDQRIDHVLIDEAQDTNQAQWDIVGALAAEFFAGAGARGDRLRTVFAVGDFKQAIYGFQGTDPETFRAARATFARHAAEAGHGFAELGLSHSFRSTRPLLGVIDRVFDGLGSASLGLEDEDIRHGGADGPGSVTLWQAVAPRTADSDDAAADDAADEADDSDGAEEGWMGKADLDFARMLARQIREWCDGALKVAEGNAARPVRPGDIMILVRKRTELVRLLVARLHEEKVPVAGVDRLLLNQPLAVQDMLACIRFVLQPADDLNLASLLVSPLVGWSHDDLHARASGRGGLSLWQHLGDAKPGPLAAMLAMADFVTPYRFLERILSGPIGGRARLLARLGEEARDPLDELLAAALRFDQSEGGSLQDFLDWFERGDVEIKRDPSQGGNAVRIMTVHGAKGLEAPVIVLADACTSAGTARPPSLSLPVPLTGAIPLPALPMPDCLGPLAALREQALLRERREHWRLLYVAMTRARQHLFVGGVLGSRAKGVVPQDSWHAAIARGLEAMGTARSDDRRWGTVLRYDGPAFRRETRVGHEKSSADRPLPDWAHRAAPPEARPPRPLAPSSLGHDDVADPPPAPMLRLAAERGRLLHALFERLPALPPEARKAAALRWLERTAGVVDAGARAAIAADVMGVLDHPGYRDIFGPGALAEAPIAAVVDGVVIAGTVDRLIVGDGHVRVIDFKTGRRVPAALADAPLAHVRQMAAYVHALRVIFPGVPVAASLLYTSGPNLVDLDEAAVAAHKPGYRAEQN